MFELKSRRGYIDSIGQSVILKRVHRTYFPICMLASLEICSKGFLFALLFYGQCVFFTSQMAVMDNLEPITEPISKSTDPDDT